MEDVLAGLAALDSGGLITAADLMGMGWHPSVIQRSVQRGELVRVRRGFYVTAERWAMSTIDDRYRQLVRAAARSATEPMVLSHYSAAALHGLPSIGRWPAQVHVTNPDATGGRSGGLRTVHRAGPRPATVEIGGVIATSLVRTLADISIAAPMHVSVPMLDAALRRELQRSRDRRGNDAAGVLRLRAAVLETIEEIAPVRGRRRAERAVAFADPRAANAGESLSRVRIADLGFAVPELQVRFDDILDSYALVDFYWRGIRLIGEFDGDMKYTRSRVLSGSDPAAVVLHEKKREDALRRRVRGVTRWDWALLRRLPAFAAQLAEAGVPRASPRR